MYENQTYEIILQRMLERVPGELDKRQGSIIYDALAPAAAELAQVYVELDNALLLGFADTSNGEWLDRRTNELGVYRKKATKAIREGTFNISVGVGERFFIDDLYFVVREGGTIATLECETAGSIGNEPIGEMIPVTTIAGLAQSTLGAVNTAGVDEESDKLLLDRYVERVQNPSTSGNKNHYIQWSREVPGVGDAKVFPLWNGGGTVKVVIVDANLAPASTQLVQAVKNYIDPIDGIGEGQAPIGATVTIESAIEKTIDIDASITLSEGGTMGKAQTEIEQGIEHYLKNIAFEETMVRISEIGSIILGCQSILDYSNLTLNATSANVQLADNEIPARGAVTLSESV